jgi:Flp pilus assembly protein TadB
MTGGLLPAVVCGALVGGGVFLFGRIWWAPRRSLSASLARLEAGSRSMTSHTVSGLEADQALSRADSVLRRLADRLEVVAVERGWRLRRVRTDLAIMGRGVGAFLASKVALSLGLLVLAPLLWSALLVTGLPLPPAVPAVGALLLAGVGFVLPDLALRGEAAHRRREFRRVVGIFLDLVAMNLAGGRGLPEALLSASTISDQWAVVRIRQALANARLFGTTPWVALGELGTQIGVEELRDLAAALALAADDGAKIRQSLAARAATLRRRELSDSEGEAGERSESMLVAQLIVCLAFLVFLAYPALAGLLNT